MVLRRLNDIPKQHRILYWRHCLQHMFGYLVFTPL